MADTRKKDVIWTVCQPGVNCTFPGAQLAVLMDIRDELKAIRARLDCNGTLGIPHKLERIARNTAGIRNRLAGKGK